MAASSFFFVEARHRMTQLQAVSTLPNDLLQGSQTEILGRVERLQCKETADDVCISYPLGWRIANPSFRKCKFFDDAYHFQIFNKKTFYKYQVAWQLEIPN